MTWNHGLVFYIYVLILSECTFAPYAIFELNIFQRVFLCSDFGLVVSYRKNIYPNGLMLSTVGKIKVIAPPEVKVPLRLCLIGTFWVYVRSLKIDFVF